MEEAVYLLGGLRSPIGLTGGVFQAIRPEELGAALFRAFLLSCLRQEKQTK